MKLADDIWVKMENIKIIKLIDIDFKFKNDHIDTKNIDIYYQVKTELYDEDLFLDLHIRNGKLSFVVGTTLDDVRPLY